MPTIVDDGATIIDSAVIMEYLDERYPEPSPLRPADLVAIAHLRSHLRYIDEVPTPSVRIPSYNLAFLPHYQAMSEAEFVALAEFEAAAQGVPAADGADRLQRRGDGRRARPAAPRRGADG